jgi:hypothetical protein
VALSPLRFADLARPRPQPKGIDVVSTLRHFAIVTYAVPPERLRPLVDARFELLTVPVNGQPRGLISIVPFAELDFRLAAYPSPQFAFRQTNYRIYGAYTRYAMETRSAWAPASLELAQEAGLQQRHAGRMRRPRWCASPTRWPATTIAGMDGWAATASGTTGCSCSRRGYVRRASSCSSE